MNSLEQLYYLIGKLETLRNKKISIEDLSFIETILEENEYFQCDNYEIVDEIIDDYDNVYFSDETYGQYRGTYAQDVEGLSDDFINDVLEGEPLAYWNID